MWSFFGFGHGKGLHNGVGVVLKRFIWRVQLDVKSIKLQNAKLVVFLLKEKLNGQPESSYSSGLRFVTHIFFHVKHVDVDRVIQYTCDAIKGIRDLYLIRSMGLMDVNMLMKKSLSCFSYFCMDGNFLACDNIPWSKDWEVEMLIPSNTAFVLEAMLDAFEYEDA
jgi:hypothetical protein